MASSYCIEHLPTLKDLTLAFSTYESAWVKCLVACTANELEAFGCKLPLEIRRGIYSVDFIVTVTLPFTFFLPRTLIPPVRAKWVVVTSCCGYSARWSSGSSRGGSDLSQRYTYMQPHMHTRTQQADSHCVDL